MTAGLVQERTEGDRVVVLRVVKDHDAVVDTRRPAYVDGADSYDARTRQYQSYRRQIVDALAPSRGDVVLDVGCGTGLCLSLLAQRVGPEGMVVGIDESPEMLAQAEQKVRAHGLGNVVLVQSRIEEFRWSGLADAALFCAVHDVLRSPQALDRVFAHLRPGAAVAAGGGKWAPVWLGGLNVGVYAMHEPFVRSFEGFDRPWSLLERYVDRLQVRDQVSGYVASGRVPDSVPWLAEDAPIAA